MPIVQFRPTSPGRRFRTGFDFSEITKARPEASLTEPLHKSGGRNNRGRMTARHRGGGHKRLYRVIDFRRDKVGVRAVVEAIEYDPNRSARIALLKYVDGARGYILAPVGLGVGDAVETGPQVTKVRTFRQLGKIRRVGRHMGRRPDWKKAYVTLAEGSRIDFFEGA